ncbi:hypothetical protein HYT56_01905 [Candidatus Woesearchaeota archaeon]|nr:hypothetical protein [Candidatus Woesearchaeota archaeon]
MSEKRRIKLEKEDKELASYLSKKYKIKLETEIYIPTSIFNEKLGTLEAIVKYLKENLNLRASEISSELKKKYSTISTTYQRASKKHSKKFLIKEFKFSIPVKILRNKKFSTLELAVSYLKENYDLTLTEISKLLHRDPKTIWTIYSRYKKK